MMRRRVFGPLLCGLLVLGGGRPLAQNPAPDHPAQYAPAEIEAGSTLYNRLCVNCHGISGTGVGGIDLHRGRLPRAGTDAALKTVIATGFPQAGMPAFPLAEPELRALVAFVRAGFDAGAPLPVALGDPLLGKAVFDGKGKCLDCHRVSDRGAYAAPDLTDIGRARAPASIWRSLVEPTASMRPINRPVRAVTRAGAVITGRRLNEDTYTVQIMSDEGRLVGLVKSELQAWSVGITSPMPSYKDTLQPDELAGLLAYLISLKGQ